MGFLNFSIKYKLLAIIMFASVVSVLIAAIAIGYFSTKNVTEQTINDLSFKSDIVTESLQAAIDFEDYARVSEILAVFKTHPEVASACLFDENSNFIDGFFKEGENQACRTFQKNNFKNTTLAESNFLVKNISINERNIGYLITEADISKTKEQAKKIIGFTIGVVAFVSLIIILPLASILQKIISSPIKELDHELMKIPHHNRLAEENLLITKDEISRIKHLFGVLMNELKKSEAANNKKRLDIERICNNYNLSLRYLGKQAGTIKHSNQLNFDYFIENEENLNRKRYVKTIREMLGVSRSLSSSYDQDIKTISSAHELSKTNLYLAVAITNEEYTDLISRSYEDVFSSYIKIPELNTVIELTNLYNFSIRQLHDLYTNIFNFIRSIIYSANSYRINIKLNNSDETGYHCVEIDCKCLSTSVSEKSSFDYDSENIDITLFLLKYSVTSASSLLNAHNLMIDFMSDDTVKISITL